MKNHTLVAVDLAKNVFEVAVSKAPGSVCLRKRLGREQFARFFAHQKSAKVLLEACSSAHHWARLLNRQGHSVVLLPPHAVRPYVPRSKTDRTDAKGILEAYRNEDLQPVPVKSVDQQALGALHRLRSAWVADRTARINTIRGILREFGIFIPVGARKVVPRVEELFQDPDSPVPEVLHEALREACKDIREFERQIRMIELQLLQFAKQSELAKWLCSVPGVGLLTSTALIASVGNIQRFKSGRRFASYLGLTPRERSSGDRRRLGRINKQGDVYLRTLLTHGARSLLWSAKRMKQPDGLRKWALGIQEKRGQNKACVALANKMARFVWVVWQQQREFVPFQKAA